MKWWNILEMIHKPCILLPKSKSNKDQKHRKPHEKWISSDFPCFKKFQSMCSTFYTDSTVTVDRNSGEIAKYEI